MRPARKPLPRQNSFQQHRPSGRSSEYKLKQHLHRYNRVKCLDTFTFFATLDVPIRRLFILTYLMKALNKTFMAYLRDKGHDVDKVQERRVHLFFNCKMSHERA